MGKLLYATCLASTIHSFQCWTASDSWRSHGCFVIASSTMHRARIRASLHCHLHNTSSSIHKVGGCEPLVDGDLSCSRDVKDKTLADYIVIGSGIGGLSCGAILARYGADVLVLESHSVPGGAAQSFEVQGYQFSGPSLFSSLSSRGPQANPLAQVLDALDEKVDCATYDSLMMYLPEGDFLSRIGPTDFFERVEIEILCFESPTWSLHKDTVIPLSKVATALPPAAIRGDIGVVITALARYAPSLVRSFIAMGPKGALGASKLLCPFSTILDSLGIKDRFLRNWLDLLSFLLSGLKAEGTLAAEVVYMFAEWYKPGSVLEYPLGGTGAIVNALIRGLRKHKGKLALNSHVKEIILEGRRAVGVRLRSGQVVVAKKAIISNASLWDTLSLLPKGAVPNDLEQRQRKTSPCNSFMHLHLGIDAKDFPSDFEIQHIVVNDWEVGVDSPQNVVLISIPSILSPDLAPEGNHVLHAYTPGTEPYHIWAGLDQHGLAYKQLKEERSEVMWKAVERVLGPYFSREKCKVKLIGTPLTHERFLCRYHGTYGPAIQAGKAIFPGSTTSIKGLYCCGDSIFPGIGIPAVAASGVITANSLVPVWEHTKFLDAIGL